VKRGRRVGTPPHHRNASDHPPAKQQLRIRETPPSPHTTSRRSGYASMRAALLLQTFDQQARRLAIQCNARHCDGGFAFLFLSIFASGVAVGDSLTRARAGLIGPTDRTPLRGRVRPAASVPGRRMRGAGRPIKWMMGHGGSSPTMIWPQVDASTSERPLLCMPVMHKPDSR
jgi:hypothetical protein